MDLFKFITTTSPTTFTEARMINGATSVMWTERYRDPGEFEIIAPLSSGLMTFLPIGAFISHTDTYEVMFVENHEIDDDENADPTIKITGRSLEAYLENRIVGMNLVRASGFGYAEYVLPPHHPWWQCMWLINEHIGNATNVNDNLENIVATFVNCPASAVAESRVIKPTNVHAALLELLMLADLGIKNVRRNPWGALFSNTTQTQMAIYKGLDRSASVIFSWKSGDLDKAEYLWSDKVSKNSAVVIGRYYTVVVDTAGYEKYNRRSMIVDGGDIDNNYATFANEGEAGSVIGQMYARGRLAIANQNRVTLTRADIANISKYQYRRDFDVGDLITLDGNFGQTAVMRVIEYAEIQDENGETGHPTLALPGV